MANEKCQMTNGKFPVLKPGEWTSTTVIPDCLYRTTKHRFLTGCNLFFIERLLINKRIAVRVGAAKILRRRIPANIAVDTRRVDVVSTRHVFLYAIVTIRQSFLPKQASGFLRNGTFDLDR
jgi:hypothetical protein